MRRRRTIQVSSLQDDFGTTSKLVQSKVMNETYPYLERSPLWRLVSAILYYVVAPIPAWLLSQIYGLRIRNRAAIRQLGGCYMYGNHTHWIDFLVPYLMAFPKRAYVVAGPVAFSVKGITNLVAMMGAVPLNNSEAGKVKFRQMLSAVIAAGNVVAVLPEAHIWPYYTGIRDFPSYSFTHPVRDAAPVLGYVTTYRQRRLLKFRPPTMTVTISPAILPETWQGQADPKQVVRDAVHNFMTTTIQSQTSFPWIEYLGETRGRF